MSTSAPVPAPPATMPPQARRRRVAALLRTGLAPHQIAAQLGVARATVQRDIKRCVRDGLLPPPPTPQEGEHR